MRQQQPSFRNNITAPIPIHLGAFLKITRDRYGITQAEVLNHLPGWQQSAYSKVEKDTRAPTFDQLVPIYKALAQSGVELTLQDRQQFTLLARRKIESMKTRHEYKSEADWGKLEIALADVDQLSIEIAHPGHSHVPSVSKQYFLESRHLVGREEWFASIVSSLQKALPKKLLILQGPVGIGKTSELHRLATYFLRSIHKYQVVLCEPPSIEQEAIAAATVLELLLADILETIGSTSASLPTTAGQLARIKYVLDMLSRVDRPVLILLDNAEHLLDQQGELAPVWRLFLTKFVQAEHRASLVLATKEWPGSFMEEAQLVMSTIIPLFSREEGSQLLQRLGVLDISDEQLDLVIEAVSGIPLCLEWVAKLIQEPLLHRDWSDFEEETGSEAILAQLLADASLFGGPVARRVQPLLERVVKRLSVEGSTALRELAVSPIALGSPALKALYHNPAPLKELRDASLLIAYPKRVQLLPMVAAAVRSHLSDEELRFAEERLIHALTHWLKTGVVSIHEQGTICMALACLLLRQHRFLAAAELILHHGWLIGQVGHILRLAHIVQREVSTSLPNASTETEVAAESGSMLLHNYLDSYLGVSIDIRTCAAAYERIRTYVSSGQITVEPLMEVHLLDPGLLYLLNNNQFEEAQLFLENFYRRMEQLFSTDYELQATFLSKQAMLCSRQSNYAQSHGDMEQAKQLREQVIATYERCICLLEEVEQGIGVGTLRESTMKKKRATFLNNLAYQLNSSGRSEEALEKINRCLDLKEQGFAERDSLVATIGEKSQILAALGKYQEALHLDKRAWEDIQHMVAAGDTSAQEEQWIYQVNRGKLYLLLGRVDDAERLLREAEPRIHVCRKVYKTQANNMLNEIKRWRTTAKIAHFQLDWRWIERFRMLCAYDAYWWWACAGPFTEEEQQLWKQFFPPVNDATKDRLRGLLVQARDRELAAALQEEREPRLHYPAIEIEVVRQRIAALFALDAEMKGEEPNVLVRRFYHGAIEDEICFLQMIEATYERKSERFWELTQQLYPPPTGDEMDYALTRVKQVVLNGLQREDTREISQQVIQVLWEKAHFSLDLPLEVQQTQHSVQNPLETTFRRQRIVSPQAVRRFFEAVLRDSGYEGWQVLLDPNATGPRIEAGSRHMILQDRPISLEDVREYLSHELLGHITRSIYGEYSLLGLLGIGTKTYLTTEEGLADYHERQVAKLHGEAFDDSGTWLGTLAVGLACGVRTTPLLFSALFAFFERFLLVYRLLWRNDEDRLTAEQRARRNATTRCLRTYRGVPDLAKPGVSFTKDIVYLRGLRTIERAVAEDETVLDRLTMGKVALELLPDLQELGMALPQQVSSIRNLAYDLNLDGYILSFEEPLDQ